MHIPFAVPSRAGRSVDLAGLGENSVDLLGVFDGPATPDTKVPLKTFAQLAGGQVATALVACARLGWRTSYLGSFGSDAFGEFSRQSLDDAGVSTADARTVADTANRLAFILVDSRSGERTVLLGPRSRLGDEQ